MTQPPRDTKQGLLVGAGKTGFSHLELLDDQLLVLAVTSPPLTCLVRNQQNQQHLLRFPKESLVAVALLCFALLVSRASQPAPRLRLLRLVLAPQVRSPRPAWLLCSRPGNPHTLRPKTWKRAVKQQSGHLITLKSFSLIKKFCETTFPGGCFLSSSQPLDVLRKLRRRWQISGRCARSV